MGTKRSGRRTWWVVGAVAVVVIAAVGAVGFAVGSRRSSAEMDHATMVEHAASVMPFDLQRTTHLFTETATGGIQTVTVKDPTDLRNRDRIRGHLRDEADRFHRGDYSDPARIHGMDMPGVRALERGASKVTVEYTDLPNGGRVVYRSSDPTMVDALHAWFDRQRSDHSMDGMGG